MWGQGRWRAGSVLVATGLLLVACSTTAAPDDEAGPPRGDGRDLAAPMPVSALEDAPAVPTVIVIDASGSMAIEDAPGQRLQAAKDAVAQVVSGLPAGHEVGIVLYGTSTGGSPEEQTAGCRDVTVAVPLGPLQPRAVADQLAPIGPSGYTPIGLSLQVAADQLPADGPRSIVVVSDGSDTCAPAGLGPDPCEIAAALHASDDELTVSTIGFRSATEPGATDQLGCMADEGGGQHHDAATATLLGTRLSATLNAGWSAQSLTGTSYRGIALGSTLEQVRALLDEEIPSIRSRGTAEVDIEGVVLEVTDGLVTSVTVTSPDVRTIDGLAVGDTVSDAERIYGPARADSRGAVVVTADSASGTGFRLAHGDRDEITAITLCACG